MLKTDFIDLQKQQNDILQTQRKHIVLKEQASSQTDSDMKSVLASESSAVSEASQQVQSDLSAVSASSGKLDDWWQMLDDQLDEMKVEEEQKKQRMAAKGKADMDAYVGNTKVLADKFIAAKATGTEDFTGATGSKLLEKDVKEGQRLDQLRVLPPGLPSYPKEITELSKDPAAIEGFRKSHGLDAPVPSQAAASSSSGRSKSRDPSTKGTRGETNDPETNVAKRRGRPVNKDSARQKAMAKAAANK